MAIYVTKTPIGPNGESDLGDYLKSGAPMPPSVTDALKPGSAPIAPATTINTGSLIAEADNRQPPLPLTVDRGSVREYPLDALGPMLGSAANEIAKIVQCPKALAGQSILGAAALAVQGHANLIIDGRVEPVSLTLLTVAESGDRKSAADDNALAPHKAHQKAECRLYEEQRLVYEAKYEQWSLLRKQAIAKGEGKKSEELCPIEDDLIDLGPGPKRPPMPRMICGDPTIEGLHRSFEKGLPSQGLMSSEGGAFFGGHAGKAENKQRTAAMLSDLHDGKEIERTRAGDGESFMLFNRRLTTHLMMQPVIAVDLLSDKVYRGQGYLARCLLSWPESIQGTRLYNNLNAMESAPLRAYVDKAFSLLQEPAGEDEDGIPELRLIGPDSQAKAVWRESYNNIERRLAPGGEAAAVAPFACKLASNIGRIAAVLALFDDLKAEGINSDQMSRAVTIGEYYLQEQLRVVNVCEADAGLSRAESLLEWLQKRALSDGRGDTPPGYVTLQEVLRFSPAGLDTRKKAAAEEVLQALADHYWIHPVDGGMVINGKRAKAVFEVVQEAAKGAD